MRIAGSTLALGALALVAAAAVVVLPPLRLPDAVAPVAPPPVAPPSAASPTDHEELADAAARRAREQPIGGDGRVQDDPVGDVEIGPISFDATRAPLGRLRIPDIGLDTPFFNGVHDEVLTNGPGHWPGTPLPGTVGNAVLSGHRTTWTAPFNRLDELTAGDTVHVAIGPERDLVYQVFQTAVVPESEYVDFVLAQPPEPGNRTITLFACHPEGDRTYRIVVRARADDAPTAST